MIGPTPGTLISRSQSASWRATASISPDRLDPLVEPAQSLARSSMIRTNAWRQDVGRRARMCGSSARKKRCPWRTGPNLIDDADALANLSFSHPVQRLQVELI